MACECEEGQVDEVGVDSHSQQQHRQLQQRVQTQEDSTSHHCDHTAQYKNLRGREGKEALTRMWVHSITSHPVGWIQDCCYAHLGVSADGEWTGRGIGFVNHISLFCVFENAPQLYKQIHI